jgi:hypothetical protein
LAIAPRGAIANPNSNPNPMTAPQNQISGTLTEAEFDRQLSELNEFCDNSDLPEDEYLAEVQKRFHPGVIEEFNDLLCSLVSIEPISDTETDRQLSELKTFWTETNLTGEALEAEAQKHFHPDVISKFRASA